MSKKHDTRELEDRIGYRFKDRRLLVLALTHASQTMGSNGDNERLEFLGDRVLGLVVSELIMELHPQARVGELAVRLNALVNKSTCASVAEVIGLGSSLRLGKGVPNPGGRPGDSVLADALEALIAAVYLDGGIAEAERLIRAFWMDRALNVSPDAEDPKSRLQVWAQARKMGLPGYQVIERVGRPHKPRFTIQVELDSGESAVATESSKKLAERAAAARLLSRLEKRNV